MASPAHAETDGERRPATFVFLTHSAVDSGAELGLVTGLSFWPKDGPRCLLVLAEDGPIVRRARRLGVEARVTPPARPAPTLRREDRNPWHVVRALRSSLGLARRLRKVLLEEHADVVVAISVKSLVYGLLAARLTHARIVWSVHDRVAADYFPRAVVPPLRHVLPRLVDGIVVNSKATLSTLRPGRTPVFIAHPPIALDERDFDAPRDPVRTVVTVGRLTPWKGQDNFLRAFARVFGGSDVTAVIVGGALFGEDVYERSLRELAESLGIGEQVHFTGHVSDVWSYLAKADIVVHSPRIPEPFGQVVVQGMWARCAVVAAAPGGPAEIIEDGVDGLLTTVGDVDALVDAHCQRFATTRSCATGSRDTRGRQPSGSTPAPRLRGCAAG